MTFVCPQVACIYPFVQFRLQVIDNCYKPLRNFLSLSLIFSDTRFEIYPAAYIRTLSELSANDGHFYQTTYSSCNTYLPCRRAELKAVQGSKWFLRNWTLGNNIIYNFFTQLTISHLSCSACLNEINSSYCA